MSFSRVVALRVNVVIVVIVRWKWRWSIGCGFYCEDLVGFARSGCGGSGRNATEFGAICVGGFDACEESRRGMGTEVAGCGDGWRGCRGGHSVRMKLKKSGAAWQITGGNPRGFCGGVLCGGVL